MTGYSDNMSGANNVVKCGSTQPYPTGGVARNPGQGTGAVPTVGVGPDSPTIVPTGATNNGGPSRGAQYNRADGRPGSGPYGARGNNP